jgi:transposase
MGWSRPGGIDCAKVAGVEAPARGRSSIKKVSIIGLDLASSVFQAHGAEANGSVAFRRKLSRAQLPKSAHQQPPCIVAIKACASAHHWGRAIGDLGRGVRLIPPACVKPLIKWRKNDMTDAVAASRPAMRFVAVKSDARQAAAMAYRTRDLLVRQRTRTINALRAHLAEQGIVAPAGPAHVGRLAAVVDGEDDALPAAAPGLARLLLDQIAALTEKVAGLDAEPRRRVTTDDTARRLTTIPGLGPIGAAAITAFAPPMETFSKGRDFAAWVGLTPRHHSSGGKERLGRASKMGRRDIRRRRSRRRWPNAWPEPPERRRARARTTEIRRWRPHRSRSSGCRRGCERDGGTHRRTVERPGRANHHSGRCATERV